MVSIGPILAAVMTPSMASSDGETGRRPWFTTTQWTVVLDAGNESSVGAQGALEELCRTYWYPLYVYVRRRGYAREDAQDLTQAFFAHLLETRAVGLARPEKGKFRSFLLTSLDHFLINEHERASAAKRGGGQTLLPLDWEMAEGRYQIEPPTEQQPEYTFDRQWALTIMERAMARLRQEYVAACKDRLFGRLKGRLQRPAQEDGYEEAANELRMTPGAVAVAVHRLRQRYRECVREEIAHTVSRPEEVDDELRYLLNILRE
jgi:RNA polymerase sigma factor (sigma-70 family)